MGPRPLAFLTLFAVGCKPATPASGTPPTSEPLVVTAAAPETTPEESTRTPTQGAPVYRAELLRQIPPPPEISCDLTSPSATRTDLNGDGKPDLVKVVVSGLLRCRAADMNFDGTFELIDHFDDAGKVWRRDADMDFDGTYDQIAVELKGRRGERWVDTDGDGRFDVFELLEDSRPVKRYQDRDGDGAVDAWWESEPGACARTLTDDDGDGVADREGESCPEP